MARTQPAGGSSTHKPSACATPRWFSFRSKQTKEKRNGSEFPVLRSCTEGTEFLIIFSGLGPAQKDVRAADHIHSREEMEPKEEQEAARQVPAAKSGAEKQGAEQQQKKTPLWCCKE